MKKTEIEIQGMTCGHCAMSISKELALVPETTVIEVNHQSGKALIQSEASEGDLAAAIEKAGYTAVKFAKVDG
jgi:copper chaperone CopZ